jgi:hypothetical protein
MNQNLRVRFMAHTEFLGHVAKHAASFEVNVEAYIEHVVQLKTH